MLVIKDIKTVYYTLIHARGNKLEGSDPRDYSPSNFRFIQKLKKSSLYYISYISYLTKD